MLFFLITMRMSGFIFLNPVLGRKNIPALAKTGMCLVLAVLVYSVEQNNYDITEPTSAIVFGVMLIKEFLLGFLLGFIMQLFDMIMSYAGAVMDFQIGLSMATVYDPQNGAQVALSGKILQTFFLLLFFAVDGHLALMKILVTSGEVVPYNEIAIGTNAAQAMLDLFMQCIVLAVKLAFPLIAFEFVTEMGIGILMKINPQINLFVLSIQLRVLVGIVILVFLVSPIGSYIGTLITTMMDSMQSILRLAAG